VLIGPAGSGKTRLLSALCDEPSVQAAGILLLAPTGKARVRLQTQVGRPAQTLAQYLFRPFGRYEPATGAYPLRPLADEEKRFKTVIVDEASMLTEDQLAALVETVGSADRIILVGDPAQLPPIGVGKPFVDLVRALEPGTASAWPRVSRGYAELTVRMRQERGREDLELAELFRGRGLRAGDDEILFQLAAKPSRERVRCVRWDTADDLRARLREVLSDEFEIDGELESLCESIGAVRDARGHWYFNQGAENLIESWQVLAPVRLLPGGTEDLNRLFQQELRGSMLRYATGKQRANFRVPRPVGPQQVVYGDKVINISNQQNRYVRPKRLNGTKPLAYIANGEIGVVIGETLSGAPFDPWFPWRLYVAFGSQPGFRYSFTAQALKEEGDSTLELAYAITVHKAQGSEFGRVFVVVPKQAPTLSRELLYTALTRHQEKLIVLHEGDITELMRFVGPTASETAKRITNINIVDERPERRPFPVAVIDQKTGRRTFYEHLLIHRTRAGQLVQSKSEVIIANELDHARERRKLRYDYEIPLSDPKSGSRRYPDFTVRDDSLGRVWYWEHRGMRDLE
jgi:ATP-dependent exoDNAse (exonuclease V) alpha subunit